MKVFPSSDGHRVGETERTQQHAPAALVHEREMNGSDIRNQVQIPNGRVSDIMKSGQGSQTARKSDGQRFGNGFSLSEGQSGAFCSDSQLESQMIYVDSSDFEDGNPNIYDFGRHVIVDTIENDESGYTDGEAYLSATKWLEYDESIAVWVKLRGKWQAGIRCVRADLPLSTLKAKPTHGRKKYCAIFFPYTKNYSWSDVQHLRPINELPDPIAYRNHKIGLKLAKDLAAARLFITKKLAFGILSILDQLHAEALIHYARDAKVWKDFAVEVSQCNCYSDLGKMLLKLQSIIMHRYVNSEWLQQSLSSWVQQCQVAQSADVVESLTEELFYSILWNEVNLLRDAPVQSVLGAEWKTWKQDMTKFFVTSHSVPDVASLEQLCCDTPSTMVVELSRKRPKLEVRRAEPHAFLVETSYSLENSTVEIDSEFFNNHETLDATTILSELPKEKELPSMANTCLEIVVGAAHSQQDVEMTPTGQYVPKKFSNSGKRSQKCTAFVESKGRQCERWANEGEVYCCAHSASRDTNLVRAEANTWLEIVVDSWKDGEMIPTGQYVPKKFSNSGKRSQQCTAFVESKGRQCERWANEGEVYCCAHSASRVTNSVKAETTPPVRTQPCGGTTVHGTICKHRALPDSSFCKKHIPKLDNRENVDSSARILKRKHDTSAIDDAFNRSSSLTRNSDNPNQDSIATEMEKCIGAGCLESPKHYSLYCANHVPSWLKHLRNDETRIISKDIFTDLLSGCHTVDQKLNLVQACELFCKIFKSVQSLRNAVSMDVQLDLALSEATKSMEVGELLFKLVCTETERLRRTWGFAPDDGTASSSIDDGRHEDGIRCKVCLHEFLDDRQLGIHFMDKHKKEARLRFGGYACAICLDPFTSKETVEIHVQERHRVSFVEQCMLLQCIPCRGHFGNKEKLWEHVLSFHAVEFRLKKGGGKQNLSSNNNVKEVSVQKPQPENACTGNNLENYDGVQQNLSLISVKNTSTGTNMENYDCMRKFTCKFCGLKFDLLPDLGRHHQAAHMRPSPISADQSSLEKNGVHHYGRLCHPQFKKGLRTARYRMENRGNGIITNHVQTPMFPGTSKLVGQSRVQASAGILDESECLEVAKKVFGDVKKTKILPSNLDILAVARTACCNVSLKAALEVKFGPLPERFILKAAKVCSEHNVEVEWHRDGFVCPRGCRHFKEPELTAPAMPRLKGCMMMIEALPSPCSLNKSWEVDECHLVVNLNDIREVPIQKSATICRDISYGKESIPVTCVVDEDLLDSFRLKTAMPWESFEYITHPLSSESDSHPIDSSDLGCSCPWPTCCLGSCNHVYLFGHDYDDARDVHGECMHGRFPYDDKGRIVLEEGCLVYECNDWCNCNKTCPNRVLQKGVQLRLEVFWTVNKGWAVRAAEPILRGMFICEYVGEVLNEAEAKQRRERCGKEGCNYMFNVDRHTNGVSRLIGVENYVIDGTKYGNISRFFNHSCSPNIVSRQVIVNSKDPRRAHIGLYANRDIASGEELTLNYQYEPLPGGGRPCLCGSSNCRGRLY